MPDRQGRLGVADVGPRRTGCNTLSFRFGPAVQLACLFTAALLPTAASAHEFSSGDIKVSHPWSRIAPAGSQAAGAYLSVTNSGTEPDRLIGGSTPAAQGIEVHQMTMDDGVARMRPRPEGMDIPAGGTTEFAPGGVHRMLINPNPRLMEGDRFKATLRFARTADVEVEFVVQRDASRETGNGTEHGGQDR